MSEERYYKPCSTCVNNECVFMGTKDTHCVCEDYKPKEQEPILDKIRAEIEKMTPTYHNPDWSISDLVPISEVLKLVDKYKPESEDKEQIVEVIARGNCMMCGKELTEGLLFFCKECEAKLKDAELIMPRRLQYKESEE